MCKDLCFETILIEDGKPKNLFYHQKRFEKTQKELFQTTHHPLLSNLIQPPSKQTLRCKITYNSTIQNIEYTPYTRTLPNEFELVFADINYPYKYLDRSEIDQLKNSSNSQEIIIIKNNLITDTSIANIALLINQQWLTPQAPLLEGTMRAKLLGEGKIKPANLTTTELKRCDGLALMNGMVGFCIVKRFSIKDFLDG
ncbi:MAG TPA: hypothetical protein ENN12_01900 [Epsilonproteobacteria bacterium]|nr:hypothetical protein [Campylobacterota bacterium]